MRRATLIALGMIAVGVGGCSRDQAVIDLTSAATDGQATTEPTSTATRPTSTATVPTSTGTEPAATDGAIVGQTVTGHAPVSRDGSLTVVILEPETAMSIETPTEPVRMDQLGMEFLPPVLLAGTGQPVHFRNSEDVLHNVRVYNIESKDTAFNISTPLGGTYEHRFDVAGTYRVACDIHPAMGASVVITAAPYATVAERDGSFVFDDVLPGAYRAIVHFGGERTEQRVDIAPSATELALD